MKQGELEQKVEERLRRLQRNKQHKDSARRVGGSRKEDAAYRLISLADLESLEADPANA